MMKIRGIRKAFGKQQVLNGVDMDVDDGEVVVILGSSGSGKTTFLRCLNFLEQADEGHIDLDDSHIDVKSSSKKDVLDYQRKTAMVFQNYALFNNKTALENIAMPMVATGSDSVAPYGVCTCTPADSSGTTRRRTAAGTGAPAEMTRRRLSSRTPAASGEKATRRSRAGEPNRLVTR